MYVCVWSPGWPIAAEPDGPAVGPRAAAPPSARESGTSEAPFDGWADVAPLLAELAPRMRVERERLWVDGRGMAAERLGERLLERLAELGVEARVGVARVPIVAQLAARYGSRTDGEAEGPTPFLVKERTGWGWRRTLKPASTGSPAVSGAGKSGRRPAHSNRSGIGSRGGAESRGEAGFRSPAAAEERTGGVVAVGRGEERAWLASLPVTVLEPDARLRPLLDGVGIETLGALAALEREAVEVRLGASAVELWRLARADDRRVLFDRIPPERPHGSLDFVDYVLTDPSRLLFTANGLLGPLCDRLVGRGEHARTLTLTLPLANGESWSRTIRPARPTASRDTWLRLIRGLLDRLTVPDAVAGMRLEVGVTEEAGVRQGDLFDRGFATAAAVEAAVARLAERQAHPLAPAPTAHPLVERRGGWRPAPEAQVDTAASLMGLEPRAQEPLPRSREPLDPTTGEPPGLSLQLLSEPRHVQVETVRRRDHEVPLRLRDRSGWQEVAVAAGPDRISGGQWERSSYAREYFRCVTGEGVPLWVFRDALGGGWYLHGWWD